MDLIDFLSHEPRVYINKKGRFYSKIGVFFSILSLATILSLVIYFVVVTLSRTTIFIRYSTSTKYDKSINLSNQPFLMSILDNSGLPYKNPEQIYTFYLAYTQYIVGNATLGTSNKLTTETTLMERCKKENYVGTLFENFPNLENYFCYIPGTRNLTIYNKFGDLTNGFGFVDVIVNRCSNTSLFYKGANCADQEVINNGLSKGYLTYTYIDNIIDHNNQTQPNIQYLANQVLDLSSTVFQRIYFTMKNVRYESEDGFVFDILSANTFPQFDSVRLYSDNRGTSFYPETISAVFIQASAVTDVYNRSYVKLQNLLANIGGVVNGILTLAAFVMNILTKRLNLMTLIDSVYKLEEERSFYNSSPTENVNKSNTNVQLVRFNNNNSPSPMIHLKPTRLSVENNNNNNSSNIIKEEGLTVIKPTTYNRENLRLSLLEYLCPFSVCSSKLNLVDKYDKVIRNELSIDNLINKSGEVSKLVELLSYEQKISFKRLNAFNLALMKVDHT
jgi:hypothetical protein